MSPLRAKPPTTMVGVESKSNGNIYITKYQKHFFCTFARFLGRPRVFSRALSCGALRGAACTPRCKCRSRPGSVALALGVQSREIWQVIAGLLSDQLESTRPMQAPKCPLYISFFHLSPASFEVTHQLSKARQQRYNSRASSVSLCDSPERYFCVRIRVRACVCVCHCRILEQKEPGTQSQAQRRLSAFFAIFHFCYAVCCCCLPVSQRKLSTMWQQRTVLLCVRVRIMWACHSEPIEGQFQPALPPNFKGTRAVQQRYNSSSSGTTPVSLPTLVCIGTPVFSVSTCDTPAISCQPHPEGGPCVCIIRTE